MCLNVYSKVKKKLENTKGVIRGVVIRRGKSKKYRQYHNQNRKDIFGPSTFALSKLGLNCCTYKIVKQTYYRKTERQINK
jgi:hypothetical protein